MSIRQEELESELEEELEFEGEWEGEWEGAPLGAAGTAARGLLGEGEEELEYEFETEGEFEGEEFFRRIRRLASRAMPVRPRCCGQQTITRRPSSSCGAARMSMCDRRTDGRR